MTFTIQLMNHYDSVYHGAWLSENWSKIARQMNPYADAGLARYQVMAFNLIRTTGAYDSIAQSQYWQWMHTRDIEEAESYFDLYSAQAVAVAAAERSYIARRLVAMEMSKTKDKDWAITEKTESPAALIPATALDGMKYFDTYALLAPYGTPYAQRWLQSHFPKDTYDKPWAGDRVIAQPADANFFRTWRNKQGRFQTNLMASHNFWGLDMANARVKHNEIIGVSGKQHTLLTNWHIPAPALGTFLAWYSMCGHAFVKLSEAWGYSLAKMVGFKPKYLLSYTLPLMPRTKEHQNNGAIRTDDSGADQSLTGKSAMHKRNEYGSIQYGQWIVRTILLGAEGERYEVADQNLSNTGMTGRSITQRHIDMLPTFFSLLAGNHNAITNPELLSHVMLPIFDPLSATQFPLHFDWGKSFNLDTPWRSLSKFKNLHFRFDDDESGELAAAGWAKAFESNAVWYAEMTNDKYNELMFSIAVTAQLSAGRNEPTTKFDLSHLGNGI